MFGDSLLLLFSSLRARHLANILLPFVLVPERNRASCKFRCCGEKSCFRLMINGSAFAASKRKVVMKTILSYITVLLLLTASQVHAQKKIIKNKKAVHSKTASTNHASAAAPTTSMLNSVGNYPAKANPNGLSSLPNNYTVSDPILTPNRPDKT